MVKTIPDPNLFNVAFGVLLVIISVVVLLAAVDLLDMDALLDGGSADVFLAFAVLALGLVYVFGYLNPREVEVIKEV